MKKIFCLIFLLLSNSAFAFDSAELVVKTLDGKTFDLKEFRGEKNVLVVFWAEWCADCIREIPRIENFYKTCRSKAEVIGISVDKRRAMEKVLQRIKNVTYPNAFFNEADENFPSFNALPTIYLVDKNGVAQEIEEVPTCSQLK